MESPCDQKTGLAFSGGGIRSAAFCSGVLRRLLQKRVHIDYLSSVSGGGYTAASYMEWKYRNGKKDDPAWHKEYFENLQKYSNPQCDCFNPPRGIMDGVVLLLGTLFLSVGVSLLKAFSFAVPIIFVINSIFGDILRNQFTCLKANKNRTVGGIPREKLLKLCLPRFGPKMQEMLQVTIPMLLFVLVTYYLATVIRRRTLKYYLTFLYRLSGGGFAMVFLPWFLQMYAYVTPPWAKYLLVSLLLVILIFIPTLRNGTFIVLIIFVYAYGVKWKVFETSVAGIEYTDELYWILVWVTAALLWILPYLGILQMYGSHYYVEWRLTRAYFSPESKAACCWPSRNERPVTLADLKGMEPEYKSNVTVNNWRKTNAQSEKDYEVLTFSPTAIERIDRKKDEVEFRSEGFIKPKDIRLSSAMATSGSAIAYDDGEKKDSHISSREIRIFFALGIGNNLVAQTGITKAWMPVVLHHQ